MRLGARTNNRAGLRTRASDHAASTFEDAYSANYRDVYRYLLALTRSRDDADDLTAATFERALRSWESVPATPLPWLLLTARRLATDRWRRARKLALITARIVPGVVDGPEAENQFWMWFDALATVLNPRQREVLVLRYQRDLSVRDIAEIMRLSESGVRTLTSRALAVLRSHPELL